MNDNFKCIYKILKTLEKAMDYNEYDFEIIGYKALGISEQRWRCYITMMADNGYITGAFIKTYSVGETVIDISDIKITLKGLEYLSENSIMQRLYQETKGVMEIIK